MSGYGVPNMTAVRSRVHLSTLGETEAGDVFYLVSDPALIVVRYDGARRFKDVFPFMLLGDEVWRSLEHVGTGNPGQRVVVLHNTRKFSEKLAESEGPD